MGKYINIEELISFIDAGHCVNPCTPFFSENDVVEMVKRINGIDIVKCKDCKHSVISHGRYCVFGDALGCLVADDFFCKNGERKETE